MKKKNLVYKNQGCKPIHQNYKVKKSKRRHNPKKKQKQTMNRNKVEILCK
jgi:ribosomal protein S8